MRLKSPVVSGREYPDVTVLRDAAVTIVGLAAQELRRRRPLRLHLVRDAAGATMKVTTKSSPTDLVTDDDTDVESMIRLWLAEERPDEAIVGEEAGGAIEITSGLRWVIDPIDGTTNYVYGIPSYAVSVAAQIDGQTVAGAVADVTRDVIYCAALGHGSQALVASRNGIKLQCSEVSSTAMALVGTGFGSVTQRRAKQGKIVGALLPRIRDIRHIGSAALDLCMVATGHLDAQYEHGLSVWDWAAGALIAAEAGAWLCVPPAGTPSSSGEIVVACAPGIACELESIFDEIGIFSPIPQT